MADREEPEEAPATWANKIVGEAKKLTGRAIDDQQLEQEGEDQLSIADDMRRKYDEKPSS